MNPTTGILLTWGNVVLASSRFARWHSGAGLLAPVSMSDREFLQRMGTCDMLLLRTFHFFVSLFNAFAGLSFKLSQ